MNMPSGSSGSSDSCLSPSPASSPLPSDQSPVDTGLESSPSKGSAGMVLGMGSCYALGTFTDNFYKQCAVLLAATLSMPEFQGYATFLYSLPFILFSAWAGWLADRMVKKYIVIAAKLTELLALIVGAYALYALWWPGILVVVFLMGLQATAFSPALNGSIPESFPLSVVPRVNSFIKLGSTVAVLAGIAAAGFFLDLRPGGIWPSFGVEDGNLYGRWVSGWFILIVALLGVLTAFTLKKRVPAASWSGGARFPWSGPVASLIHLYEYRKDPLLFFILMAEGLFYGVAAIAVIGVANLSTSLGYTPTVASLLSASIMVGIAVGAIFAGRFDAFSWKRLLAPSAIGMGGFLILVATTPLIPEGLGVGSIPLRLLWLFIALFSAGVFGGVYLIPVASFIQVRPEAHEKGKVIGISNFFSFVAIGAFGLLFIPVSLLPPAWTFCIFGGAFVLFGVFAWPAIRRFSL